MFDLFEAIDKVGLPAPKGILQVGASFGQEFERFRACGVSHGLFIEPLTGPYQHVAQMCQTVPGFVAFNALCSDVPGETHTFHVASNGGMSSSILKPKGHLQVFGRVKFEQTVELVSTTVDLIAQFLAANGQRTAIEALDTLYLDVQGAEYKVLLGAVRTLKRINYVYTELIRNELYEDMLSLNAYLAFFESQGFVLNRLEYNALHHADALFVRKSLLGLR